MTTDDLIDAAEKAANRVFYTKGCVDPTMPLILESLRDGTIVAPEGVSDGRFAAVVLRAVLQVDVDALPGD